MKKHVTNILLALLVLLNFSEVYAQAKKNKAKMIDSLTKVVETRPEDTLKVGAYNSLAWELKNTGKYDLAVSYGKRGLILAEKLNDTIGVAELLNGLGVTYFRKGQYDSAIHFLNRALEVKTQRKDTSGVGMTYNNFGLVYLDQGNYPLALEYFLKSLSIKEKTKDSSGTLSALGNMGIVYNALEMPDTSLVYFERALAIAISIDDDRAIAYSENNIGVIWYKKKEYDKALGYFERALEAKIKIDDKRGIGGVHANIAAIYDAQGMFEEALVEFDTALAMLRLMGDKEGVSSTVNLKGSTLVKMKRYKEAEVCLVEAYGIATESNNLPEVQNACEGLAMVYEGLGDYTKAYAYYKQYSELKDSLSSEETTRKAVTTRLGYDYEKKAAVARAEEDAKELIRQQEASRQKLYFVFVSGIAVLVLLLALFIFRGYRQKQKVNLELDEKNIKIEGAYRIIEHKNKEITDSINYARGIQRAILPEQEFVKECLPNAFIYYKPKDIVGGDFYYLNKGSGNNIFLAAADCTGHGVPGAFMSLICSRELKLANSISGSPAQILHLVNKGVKETLRQNHLESSHDGMDIAFVRIGPTGVTYSGANRPLWILRAGASDMEEIKATKVAIGGYTPNEQIFEEHSIHVNSGDRIYLFSDGYADQFGGEKGKKLTTRKFKELLINNSSLNMEAQHKALQSFIEEWSGPIEQIDDLLVIGIQI